MFNYTGCAYFVNEVEEHAIDPGFYCDPFDSLLVDINSVLAGGVLHE